MSRDHLLTRLTALSISIQLPDVTTVAVRSSTIPRTRTGMAQRKVGSEYDATIFGAFRFSCSRSPLCCAESRSDTNSNTASGPVRSRSQRTCSIQLFVLGIRMQASTASTTPPSCFIWTRLIRARRATSTRSPRHQRIASTTAYFQMPEEGRCKRICADNRASFALHFLKMGSGSSRREKPCDITRRGAQPSCLLH
jgi:hypothetical protein